MQVCRRHQWWRWWDVFSERTGWGDKMICSGGLFAVICFTVGSGLHTGGTHCKQTVVASKEGWDLLILYKAFTCFSWKNCIEVCVLVSVWKFILLLFFHEKNRVSTLERWAEKWVIRKNCQQLRMAAVIRLSPGSKDTAPLFRNLFFLCQNCPPCTQVD